MPELFVIHSNHLYQPQSFGSRSRYNQEESAGTPGNGSTKKPRFDCENSSWLASHFNQKLGRVLPERGWRFAILTLRLTFRATVGKQKKVRFIRALLSKKPFIFIITHSEQYYTPLWHHFCYYNGIFSPIPFLLTIDSFLLFENYLLFIYDIIYLYWIIIFSRESRGKTRNSARAKWENAYSLLVLRSPGSLHLI